MQVDIEAAGEEGTNRAWLSVLRRYLAALLFGMLVWEFGQLPLYTVWYEGTRGKILVAAIHCTGADLLIGASALLLSLVIVADHKWPHTRYRLVTVWAIAAGLSYTAFSEWFNIIVRKSWQYSQLMPVIDLFGFELGLTPLAQWLLVPMLAFWFARRAAVP
jgi:hypothetical protein